MPGIATGDRLKRFQELVILECVVALLIEHGICFRHEGLLTFPTLFPETTSGTKEQLAHSVTLYYDFTGAIDNIYASLVAWLVMSREFGEGRLWPGRVEFDDSSEGVCGIRQIKRDGGLAHIDVYFAEDTASTRRDFFISFVEDHLRRHGVEVKEHQAITCQCTYEIGQSIVKERIARGDGDVICPICGRRTLISEGVATIRSRDPESDRKVYALRTRIEKRAAEQAEKAKSIVSAGDQIRRQHDQQIPIRVLHLSDLHFTKTTSTTAALQCLVDDLRKGDALLSAR